MLCFLKDTPIQITNKLNDEQLMRIQKDTKLISNLVITSMVDWTGRALHGYTDPQAGTTGNTGKEEEKQGLVKKARVVDSVAPVVELMDRNDKSVKANGTDVPEYLWDLELVPDSNPRGIYSCPASAASPLSQMVEMAHSKGVFPVVL